MPICFFPRLRLGHLHIFCCPAGEKLLEVVQAVVNGDWTGRFVGGIATPTAELGDDPSRPGERFLAVRIALERGFAIEAIVDRIEGFEVLQRLLVLLPPLLLSLLLAELVQRRVEVRLEALVERFDLIAFPYRRGRRTFRPAFFPREWT